MALIVADRVKETTDTTGGTNAYNLLGAETGFQAFSSTVGDGNTTYYACTDGTDFEIGIGTYASSTDTLARTTILQSSNSDSAVVWSAGTKDIFVTLPADKAIFEDASNNVAIGNNITVGGTVDGVDIATRDGVLTSTTTTANAAMPKAGGTFTGDVTFNDNVNLYLGTDSDLQLRHSNSNALIGNNNGPFFIVQYDDDNDIILRSDDGSGGVTNYFRGEGLTGEAQLYHYGSEKLATKTGGVDVTGNITVSGTVDGRDVATDGTKLDGIEASADVTDATNVQAAGALMDSELAYEAAVKAIDQDLSTTGIVQFLSVQAPTVYIPSAGGSGLLFEGSTADIYETSVVATDPTADRTITLPDVTGTVLTTGNLTEITNLGVLTGDISFEGATANDFETTLTVTDPTADQTITLPDNSGTVVLLDSAGDITFETADANKTIVFDKSADALHFKRPTGSDAYGKSPEITFGTFSNAKIFEEATIGASNNGLNLVDDGGKIHLDAGAITFRNGDASGEETLEISPVRSGSSVSLVSLYQPELNPTTHPTSVAYNHNLYIGALGSVTYTADYGNNTTFDEFGLSFILDKEQDTVANNDAIALLIFQGNDSAGNNHGYAKITGIMQDVTNTSEDGILRFSVSSGGSYVDYFQIDGDGDHTLFLKPIAFEGSTANDFETTLDVVDPTQDNTLNLPDESGTIATRAHAVALASVLG